MIKESKELEELLKLYFHDSVECRNFDQQGYNYQSTRGYQKLKEYIEKLQNELESMFKRFAHADVENKKEKDSLKEVLKETENSLRSANLRIMDLEKENSRLEGINKMLSTDPDDYEFDDYDFPIKAGIDPTDLD